MKGKPEIILGEIAVRGPSTIYRLHRALKIPLSTVQRNIRTLLSRRQIILYGEEIHQSRRIKKYYGLTPLGLVRTFQLKDRNVIDSFHEVARIWFREKNFLPNFKEFLPAIGDPRCLTSLKGLYEIMAEGVEIVENVKDLDPQLQLSLAIDIVIGSRPLAAAEILGVLYKTIPSFREAVDEHFQRMGKLYEIIRSPN